MEDLKKLEKDFNRGVLELKKEIIKKSDGGKRFRKIICKIPLDKNNIKCLLIYIEPISFLSNLFKSKINHIKFYWKLIDYENTENYKTISDICCNNNINYLVSCFGFDEFENTLLLYKYRNYIRSLVEGKFKIYYDKLRKTEKVDYKFVR